MCDMAPIKPKRLCYFFFLSSIIIFSSSLGKKSSQQTNSGAVRADEKNELLETTATTSLNTLVPLEQPVSVFDATKIAEDGSSPFRLPPSVCLGFEHAPVVFENHVLSDGAKAGLFHDLGKAENVENCANLCCNTSNCHVAILSNDSCSGITCISPLTCQPIAATDLKSSTYLILVRNIPQNLWTVRERSSLPSLRSDAVAVGNLVVTASPTAEGTPFNKSCELYMNQCGENEMCVPFSTTSKRRDGVCLCKVGYTRNMTTGHCDGGIGSTMPPKSEATTTSPLISNGTATISAEVRNNSSETSPVSPVPEILKVSVNNKTVMLSEGSSYYEQSVPLSAYVIGVCKTCVYEWELLKQPQTTGEETTGSITEPYSQTIKLSHLLPGTYLFSVKVTKPSDDLKIPAAVGSAVANLTVLVPTKSNQPPIAVIVPPKQTVTLPNSAVILDGSGSEDDFTDSTKLEFKWELVVKPLGYNLEKQTGQALKLQNLLPGNYTIMLKVKDEGGLEGNATAVVAVVQEKDYPPSANAGGDQIVYLPDTHAVMNGSASSDDHGIVEWEWTKGPDDDGLAVDMQDTRKPLLKLSGLEEGHYQFVLTVVDSSGQSDRSLANVYVHRADSAELKADAGADISITLPVTSTVLNGTKSTGSTPDTVASWSQIVGPNVAQIAPIDNNLTVSVTGLTRGTYIFQLTISSKLVSKTSTDNVTVIVTQEKNAYPKANGGGDFKVILPVSLVQVNGSASSDDVAIVKWLWERLPTSLAAGHVLGQSSSAPVLLLTGLVTGQYQWRLTVWDDQGASDSDTVSFIVKPGIHQKDHVAVVLGAGIESVSASQMSNLMQAMKLMLPSTVTLQIIDFIGLPYAGESSVIILGHNENIPSIATEGAEVVAGVELAAMLNAGVKTAFAGSSHLLDLPVISIHTVICQNNCSGHGECDQVRKECVCDSWWMESFVRRHFGDTMPNCDWSVVYVFVSSIAVASISVLLVWALVAVLAKKKARRPRKPSPDSDGGWWGKWCSKRNSGNHKRRTPRYTLLEDEGVKMRNRSGLLDSNSDSGSDTDILFDSRNKRHKNGHLKLPMSKLRA